MNFFGRVPHTGDGTQVTPTVDGYKNPPAYGHGTFPVYWMLNFFGKYQYLYALVGLLTDWLRNDCAWAGL